MELVAEFVARPAGSGAEGIAALNHESGDHAMEDQAVIEGLLHLLPASRIGPFLRPLGQPDEVCHRVWRLRLEELNSKWPLIGVKTRLQH